MGDVRHVGVGVRQDVVVSSSLPVADAARPASGAVLEAVLERITYANEETGYTIARVATDRSGTDLLTVVGSLLGVQPGESLRLVGRWGSHPKYGRQFEVHSFTTVLPATIQGIERYLGSGLIKGIGPKMAGRIVGHFGADTLRVIEQEPGRLVEVPGLGPKRTRMIGAAWEEQKAIKEVMVFLQGVGVSTSLAVRIYKKYGDASISVVRHEPGGAPGAVPPRRDLPGRKPAAAAFHQRGPDARVRERGLGQGTVVAEVPHRRGPRPRAGAGRSAGVDVEGRRADRRTGLR